MEERPEPDGRGPWRSPRAAVRALVRGAVVGLATSLAGLLLVPRIDEEPLGPLIRLAVIAPAALYVLWWLVVPGLGGDRERDLGSERVPEVVAEVVLPVMELVAADEDFSRERPPQRAGGAEGVALGATVRRQHQQPPPELRPRFWRADAS